MISKTPKFSVAILTSVIAAPAFAGGFAEPVVVAAPAAVVQAQPVVQAPGWGGFYLGAQAGTVGVESEINDPDFSDFTLEFDGSLYGVHVGYMYDLGNFVLGGEFDYDMINLDEVTSGFPGDVISGDVDEDGSVMRLKARAGYNLGRFLPYATAGIARLSLDDRPFGDETTDGTFVGVGAVFKATDNILIGAEFLRHQFDEAFGDDALDLEADTLSLRASYRF